MATIAVIIRLINEFRTYGLSYIPTKRGPGKPTEAPCFFAYRHTVLGVHLNEAPPSPWCCC